MAIAPVTEAQDRIARRAYADFGKASGHPAKLNFGDCFAYALAKEKKGAVAIQGQRLLAYGRDTRPPPVSRFNLGTPRTPSSRL